MRSKRRKELACPERGGGCECNEQTEGLHRGCSCLRQPSVNPPCGVLPAPRPGSLLVRFTNSYIKPALKGEVAASATSRRRGCIGAALVCVNPQSIRLAAYCQLPGRGAFNSLSLACGSTAPPQAVAPFGAPLTKSCPRLRGKWHGEAMTKGERLNQPKSPSYSPSVGSRRQLPRKRWSLFARFYLSFILAPP